MDPTELALAGISRQAQMVRDGEVSATELVSLYLERIERIDPQLNSFRTVYAEQALAEARLADERRGDAERPLNGVAIAVKDCHDVAGDLTSHGSNAFDQPAAEDCELVRRLRDAGAIILGKTTLPELAIYGFTESEALGITRNPWNTERTPAGSSGGSGAAVAAGLCSAATASDGAGSIRFPASNCGLVGLKPSRGRVSLAPLAEHWHGLSVYGGLARTVADVALYMDTVAGSTPIDADAAPTPERPFAESAKTSPGKLRIAWSTKPPRAVAPPIVGDEVQAAMHATLEVARGLGHQVEERDPAWGSLGNAITAHYLRGIRDDAVGSPHYERLERRTRGISRLGGLISDRMIERAKDGRAAHAARINAIFDDFDVLVTPVAGEPPVEIGRWAGRSGARTVIGMSRTYPFGVAWNVLGNPALVVPSTLTESGPVGTMIIGRPNDEATLLSLGAQLEAEVGWADRRPPLALA
ncbi:MAG: amidase [Solirubrobacterales bacterium]|nr:amidase [Solirubrobacterales bacterium]